MSSPPNFIGSDRPRSRRRRFRRIVLAVAGLLLVAVIVIVGSTSWGAAFGGTPAGERLARMARSPHFHDGHFFNDYSPLTPPVGRVNDALLDLLKGAPDRRPAGPLPRASRDEILRTLAMPPASGLRITWLGHSTALIEIDGRRFLTDPMFSTRASPSALIGGRRFAPPPLAITDLPPLDGVLLSHDHYDHLDLASIRALNKRGVRFYAPLGVGAHLARWGVPPNRIVEHDWWERSPIGDVTLIATPARHFSGRRLADFNRTFWCSWTLIGPAHRVFFSGDTGLMSAFATVNREFGPFDVALLDIGAWNASWSDIHLGPRGALDALELLGARRLIPIHWATFNLSTHAWWEPGETLVTEAAPRHIDVLTPILGASLEPTLSPPTKRWWHEAGLVSGN